MPTPLHDYIGDRPARFTGVRRCQWSAALGAALVAAIAYLGLVTLLNGIVHGDSPWATFHMVGAIVLGSEALEHPDVFDPAIVGAAAAVHLGLAAIYGVALSQLAVGFSRRAALPLGLVAGTVLYFVNFHGFTEFFPWFAHARGGEILFAHMIFGAVLTGTYWVFHSEERERLAL